MKTALLALFVLASAPAFAKGAKHHCVNSDGSEVAAQTKKECKKAGGKWKKMKKGEAAAAGSTDTTATPPAK